MLGQYCGHSHILARTARPASRRSRAAGYGFLRLKPTPSAAEPGALPRKFVKLPFIWLASFRWPDSPSRPPKGTIAVAHCVSRAEAACRAGPVSSAQSPPKWRRLGIRARLVVCISQFAERGWLRAPFQRLYSQSSAQFAIAKAPAPAMAIAMPLPRIDPSIHPMMAHSQPHSNDRTVGRGKDHTVHAQIRAT
jgi:hypothetical protein